MCTYPYMSCVYRSPQSPEEITGCPGESISAHILPEEVFFFSPTGHSIRMSKLRPLLSSHFLYCYFDFISFLGVLMSCTCEALCQTQSLRRTRIGSVVNACLAYVRPWAKETDTKQGGDCAEPRRRAMGNGRTLSQMTEGLQPTKMIT